MTDRGERIRPITIYETEKTALPGADAATLWTMLLSGAVASVAFDFFGQSLSPMLGFANLAPVPLANNAIRVVFRESYTAGAHFLHYLAGLVAYPLGWMAIARALAARLVPALPWWLAAAAYGVVLWVFALYVWHIRWPATRPSWPAPASPGWRWSGT